jgi:hypothetical protein
MKIQIQASYEDGKVISWMVGPEKESTQGFGMGYPRGYGKTQEEAIKNLQRKREDRELERLSEKFIEI